MEILDLIDQEKLQRLQDLFADATGVAVSMIDKEGKHVTKVSNFLDFCMKYTRGSEIGLKRCQKCDMEGVGTYFCHAGLMDFAADIVVEGEKLGAILGGQVLPAPPDFDKFRKVAEEIGVDPDEYIEALKEVPVKTEKAIRASAALMEEMINMLVNSEYTRYREKNKINTIDKEIDVTTQNVEQIESMVQDLTKVSRKQNILALNASIEAARAGEAGRGFNIVAGEMGKLSSMATEKYSAIIAKAGEIDESLRKINEEFSKSLENKGEESEIPENL
ncbi:PocR ligand-binding domain-containing protein [Lachnospiraceae bacterium KK002]